MRLVPVLCIAIGGMTLLTGGHAAAAARHDHAPSVAAPAAAVEVVLAAPATPRAPRSITTPSTFAMGVLTLLALGEMYRRRRRFVAETAAL